MARIRKVLFWLHLTLGSAVGILIFVMSATGVLLSFQRQCVQWADRNVRTVERAHAQRLSLNELLVSVEKAEQRRPSNLTLRPAQDASVEAGFGRGSTVYVNPYSGETLGEGDASVRGFFRAVENLHRALGASLRGSIGRSLTALANLFFLILVTSGFYLWWPRKWNWQNWKAALLFRRGIKGRAWNWKMHNVIGAWCVAPLFFIALSGVVMSYPWANSLLYRAFGSSPPAEGGRPQNGRRNRSAGGQSGVAPEVNVPAIDLDQIYAHATQSANGWNSIAIALPGGRDAEVRVTINTGAAGQPQKRIDWTLSSDGTRVLSEHRFTDDPLAQRARALVRFGHTGEAGGLLGQFIAAIASLGACFLVWTGLAMALHRARKFMRGRTSREAKVSVLT